MTKIIVEDSLVNNIPVISIYKENAKKLPLIFFIHGYGGDKEQALEFGHMLAKQGFYFVSIDCMDHGERKKEDSRNKFEPVYPHDTGIDTYIHMHEVIEQTGEDVQLVIEYFKDNQVVDLTRIGISGFSMGGFASFYIAANNPDVKVAVPIAGKPSFYKAWQDVILATSTYEQWASDLQELQKETEQRSLFIKEIDPFEKIDSFAPKPLLIINGDQDTDQLYLYSLGLYKKLLPLYSGQEEKLKLSMPFINHQFVYSMKLEACNWFKKHL